MKKINILYQFRFFLWIVVSAFGMISTGAEGVAVAADGTGYDPQGKRDPFVPLVTHNSRRSAALSTVAGVDDISVEGVVFDPGKGSVVIINGAVVREGEEISGVLVKQISRTGVLFVINGEESFKPLHQEESNGT